MKTNVIVLLFFCAFVTISFSSCKGSGGKRTATEAIEFIEKKTAGKAASSIEREAGQIERTIEENADDAYNSTSSRRVRRLRHSFDEGNDGNEDNIDNNEEYGETTTQAYTTVCPYCNGGGIVYARDIYGNVLIDYYGNPQTTVCGNCGGNGQVIVYQ